MIPKIYKGEFSVIQCKGALASLTVAMKSVTPAKRQKSMLMNLLLQIERLSTGKRSVELSVRKEGELPSYNGKPKKISGLSRRYQSEVTIGNRKE